MTTDPVLDLSELAPTRRMVRLPDGVECGMKDPAELSFQERARVQQQMTRVSELYDRVGRDDADQSAVDSLEQELRLMVRFILPDATSEQIDALSALNLDKVTTGFLARFGTMMNEVLDETGAAGTMEMVART